MERLVAFDSVRQRLLARCAPVAETERVPLARALGRRLAAGLAVEAPFPATALAAGDGLAVRAEDSLGASPYNPLPVAADMGVPVEPGDALPGGADAVAPWEAVETLGGTWALIGEVDAGQGACRPGQLLRAGEVALVAGHRLGAADLALIAALGHGSVDVLRQPVAVLLRTREAVQAEPLDFLLAPLLEADGAEIRVRSAGGDLDRALTEIAAEADLLLVIGGTGEGPSGVAPAALARAGTLDAHQVALRPGRAMGAGRVGATPVLLVPPEPVAAQAVCELLAGVAVRALAGAGDPDLPHGTVAAPLARKVVSSLGELGYVRAVVVDEAIHPEPAGTDLDLPALSRTSGFVLVAPDSEGHPPGAVVTFYRDRC